MKGMQKSYAFVLPWSVDLLGGVNQVVENLIKEVGTSGDYDPILIENHWPSIRPLIEKRQDYTRVQVRLRDLFYSSSWIALVTSLGWLPYSLSILARLVTVKRIEVINVQFPGLSALNWIILRKLGLWKGKVILSFHGSDIRSALDLRGLPRAAFKYLMRQADAVVSCSEGLQTEVLALEPRAQATVIYNGIDEQRFLRKLATKRATPEIVRNGEFILNIGMYAYRKGHDLLLEAFRRVLESRPVTHLVIAGGMGPEFEATKNRVSKDQELSSHVTLYHDLPHTAIAELLTEADLFVLSSRWVTGKLGEGFPMAILEAAVAGTPIVTTRTCGAVEIVEDGVTGRLVPVEDVNALAKAICELLDDPDLRRFMAERMLRKVREEFTWKRAYQRYRSLCQP